MDEVFRLTWQARAVQWLLDRRFPERDPWPRQVHLTVRGLSWPDGHGGVREIAFADVVGVQADGNIRIVIASQSSAVPIVGSAYRRGKRLVDAIDKAVPQSLRFGRNSRQT